LTILSQVAAHTGATLGKVGGKKGKPPKVRRNRLAAELFQRLSGLVVGSQEDTAELARQLWNIYFPDQKIMECEAMMMIVRRQSGKKSRGQKSSD